LDLFALPPTQTSVIGGSWVPYKPIASLGPDTPIEFHIPANSDHYIDLKNTELHLKVKLTKGDGAALIDTEKSALVNNALHSIFSDVTVSLNSKVLNNSANLYPYRAYIEELLSYNNEAKLTRGNCQMWYADTAGKFDSLTAVAATQNDGFVAREQLCEVSRVVDLVGRPHCDIFLQNRYLPNGVDMVVKFMPNRSSFSVMSGTQGVVFKILSATLKVRKLEMNPSLLIAQARALERNNMKIPINRVDMKSVTISSNVQSKTIANHYIGQLPTRIILGFVDNAAVNGALGRNPFNFTHHGLNYLSLSVDGKAIPMQPLTPNYTDGLYTEAYYTTFNGVNLSLQDDGHSITLSDYPNGYCLYCFDLTSDLSASSPYWSLRKQGTLQIDIKFAAALTTPVNLITYSEFQNLVEIDKQRNVLTDY
jgi:hypothetical protein